MAYGNVMRIGELVKRTQVSRQTIHHYINAGVLPKPRKLGRNAADYGERYVEQIRAIKELQQNHFLPLSEIKKVLRRRGRSLGSEALALQLQSKYFRPLNRLVPDEIAGKTAFRKATGLSAKWLGRLEEWGIVTPRKRRGKWVYSYDDVTIGKLVVELGSIGPGPGEGLSPEELKRASDVFREAIDKGRRQFLKAFSGSLSSGEMQEKRLKINELMGIYYYHLYRKYSEPGQR